MNERERVEFNIIIGHLYKNLGDDLLRKLRPGLEYYRSLEGKLQEVSKERDGLVTELVALKGENGRYKAGNATTAEIKRQDGSEGHGTGKCRKSEIRASWEPEPQTPGDGSGVVGAALERDEDKRSTERVQTVVVKKSFFSKLFGG